MTVHEQAVPASELTPPRLRSSRPHELREIIEHAAHLLPAQGPITAFVHHNTLHAFEDLPFDEAVVKASRVFGCEPYLTESHFRELLQCGRMTVQDLREVLLNDMGEHVDALIGRLGTRYYLRLAMLQYPLRTAPRHELRWFVAETDALRRFRAESPPNVRRRMVDETRHWVMRDLRNGTAAGGNEAAHGSALRRVAGRLIDRNGRKRIEEWGDEIWESLCLQLLWHVCRRGVSEVPPVPEAPAMAVRHRDLLLRATGEDSDRLVYDLLIRLCEAFLDQGTATWPLPHRDEGLYHAFLALYSQPGGPPDRWLRGLRNELQRLAESRTPPLGSIEESLEILGVACDEWEVYLTETLLALRGWAGMIWQTESRPDRVARPAPQGSLIDFLAVRLILERFALASVAEAAIGFRGPLQELRSHLAEKPRHEGGTCLERRAFWVFQLAQVLGWTPRELHQLSRAEWVNLVREIEGFSSFERRRVFQQAYERRYRIQTLDAVVHHARHTSPPAGRPRYQVICCIDEREESFRRHLEEISPECETLGAAGFFGVAMYYRGAGDAHFKPLCPAVIRPTHYVREEAVYTFEELHHRRTKVRQMIGAASHQMHVGSRSFAGGAFLATVLGPLASIPLTARVLFPRLTARLRRNFGRFVQLPPVTKLQLERHEAEPGPDGGHVGFTVGEMAEVVECLLRETGLASGFSPLVVVMGHGSSSLNNPHEAAHDCGACGGARGGPNARAFAEMANDPRVRRMVSGGGLMIPEGTVFIGAYHNTCDDSVTYFDIDRLPFTHKVLFAEVRREIDLARERSAHERCRRFESAPLNLTPDAALRHVEGRAEDLAQTRPEYGHATNALCFVGPRWRNRGLFLDRRAFLTSYDPQQDDEDCTILTRVLQAVIPVCAGINLEYYFSFVDSTGYGCGTKLPHNVTSLLGVMDGAASDLRPGLPWQMVEIHEPVRLLLLIETTPRAMHSLMDRNPAIGLLCRNEWVQLAVQDPGSSDVFVFRRGQFEPYRPESNELPVVRSSQEWYRGWREHLGFASVRTSGHAGGENGRPVTERRN